MRKNKKPRAVANLPPKGDKQKELTRLEGLAKLPARTDRPRKVKLDEVIQCTAVFQPREMDGRAGSKSDRHVRRLVNGINTSKTGDLDPVLVMPLGTRWLLIEGHHRVAAYKSVGRTKTIPVEIFGGSLDEAIAQSIGRNSKDKLPLSLNERREAAWTLVNMWKTDEDGTVIYKYKVNDIVEMSGMSIRSVKKQREVRKVIKAMKKPNGDPQYTDDNLRAMAYWQAERVYEGQEYTGAAVDYDLQAAVTDYVSRLEKTFGASWTEQAEAFALALIAASENGAGLVNGHLTEELGTDPDGQLGEPEMTEAELERKLLAHLDSAGDGFIRQVTQKLNQGGDF